MHDFTNRETHDAANRASPRKVPGHRLTILGPFSLHPVPPVDVQSQEVSDVRRLSIKRFIALYYLQTILLENIKLKMQSLHVHNNLFDGRIGER